MTDRGADQERRRDVFPERPGPPAGVAVERTRDRKLDEAEEERGPLEPVAAAEDPRHEIEHQHHLRDGRGKHQQREPEAPGSEERRREDGHLDEQRRQLEVVVERHRRRPQGRSASSSCPGQEPR